MGRKVNPYPGFINGYNSNANEGTTSNDRHPEHPAFQPDGITPLSDGEHEVVKSISFIGRTKSGMQPFVYRYADIKYRTLDVLIEDCKRDAIDYNFVYLAIAPEKKEKFKDASHYKILGNLPGKEQDGINPDLLDLWGECENFYGDPHKKETGRQLLQRIETVYNVSKISHGATWQQNQYSDRWINVSERLPDDGRRVLVLIDNKHTIFPHSYQDGKWYEYGIPFKGNHNITHWKDYEDLPAAPLTK